MSGVIGTSPNMKSGVLGQYPAGHVIGHTNKTVNDASSIGTSQTSAQDSGIYIVHTAKDSSSNSYMEFNFSCGMGYQQSDNAQANIDICLTSPSSTTYSDANSILKATHSYPWFKMARHIDEYEAYSVRAACGLDTGMGVSGNKGTWVAGDELHFRIFYWSSSGEWRLVHQDACYVVTVTEIMRNT